MNCRNCFSLKFGGSTLKMGKTFSILQSGNELRSENIYNVFTNCVARISLIWLMWQNVMDGNSSSGTGTWFDSIEICVGLPVYLSQKVNIRTVATRMPIVQIMIQMSLLDPKEKWSNEEIWIFGDCGWNYYHWHRLGPNISFWIDQILESLYRWNTRIFDEC